MNQNTDYIFKIFNHFFILYTWDFLNNIRDWSMMWINKNQHEKYAAKEEFIL
jgi:hypothetical protein